MHSFQRFFIFCLAFAVSFLAPMPLGLPQIDAQGGGLPTTPQTIPQTIRLTPKLLWKLARLGEAAVSNDGGTIAYTVRSYNLKDNRGKTALHLLDLKSGKDITIIENWDSIASIQWHGQTGNSRIYFEGTGGDDPAADAIVDSEDLTGLTAPAPSEPEAGKTKQENDQNLANSNQAWYLDVQTRATVQVTSIADGISNLKVSPDGERLAFTARVKMRPKTTDIYPDLPKAQARIIDGLMYRHWDQWSDYKYSHIFISQINEKGCCGATFDLMKGIEADCPVPPFGGSTQFAWSPDGNEIAFTLKDAADWAQSTDSNIYVVKASADQQPINLTAANKGYDLEPVYSPDGKSIAFLSMQRGGFESDRARVMLYDRRTKQTTELTAGLDQTAHGLHWSADGQQVIFGSETKGTTQIFAIDIPGTLNRDANPAVPLPDTENPVLRQLSEGRFNWSVADVVPDNRFLLVKRMDMMRPHELFLLDTRDRSAKPLTKLNDKIFSRLELPIVEERFVEATDGEKIHTWVIYPPGFDPLSKKKWPMLTYCQGGPQSQVGQWFSYRWNFHLMAARGYVVVAPNRRGLPGFGQKWNDQISKDWGGQAMQDLLSATDSMTAEPYIDKSKVAAVGASFGGYSVYWLMGHHEKRFSAMIAHCGVFNLESMYGSTEELFFVNWDMGGPYWQSSQLKDRYQKFSPHQFVQNWDAPLLVIHGQKDFRVPVTQAMEAFTAAQVNKIPSRFLYFPEEGHWVQSPQNSVLWHRVFFDWLKRYCPPRERGLPKTSARILPNVHGTAAMP